MIACHVRDGAFVAEALPCIMSCKDAGADTSAEKKPHRLGRDIDARAHFTQFAGRFEHRDARAHVGCGKVAEACANDYGVRGSSVDRSRGTVPSQRECIVQVLGACFVAGA